MLFVFLILSFTVVVTTADNVQVGVITKPNVAVRSKDDMVNIRQFGRLPLSMIVPPLAMLPLGSLVTWSTNNQFHSNNSMLLIMYPYVGYVDVTSVMTVDPSATAPISSLSLFTSLPMLFSAGKSVLASRRLSLAWVDQWPVGTGAVGALVGGDISEEMIPLSVADFFAIDKNAYLRHYKEKLSSPTINVDAFRAAREALINNDIKEAEKFVGKIRGAPEGRFEYTADLILSFHRRKGSNEGKANEKNSNQGSKESEKKENKDMKKGTKDSMLVPLKSVKNVLQEILTQSKHPPKPPSPLQVELTHLTYYIYHLIDSNTYSPSNSLLAATTAAATTVAATTTTKTTTTTTTTTTAAAAAAAAATISRRSSSTTDDPQDRRCPPQPRD